MTDYYLKGWYPFAGAANYLGPWTSSATWVAGARCTSSSFGNRVFECTTSGAGGAAEPAWNTTLGATTTDGTAVWTARSLTTWANATWSLEQIAALAIAADTAYIYDHTTPYSSASFALSAVNTTAPVRLISTLDSTNEPPLTSVLSSVINVNGGVSATFTGSVYVFGLTVAASGSGTAVTITLGSATQSIQTWENCAFQIANTNGNTAIVLGSTSLATPQEIKWRDVTLSFGNAGQGVAVYSDLHWNGGAVTLGVSPITLFEVIGGSATGVKILIENVDFSNLDVGFNLLSAAANTTLVLDVIVRNCKFPADWIGSFVTGSAQLSPTSRYAMYNCNVGGVILDWIDDRVRGGVYSTDGEYFLIDGATDGTRQPSLQMLTSSTSLLTPTVTDWIAVRLDEDGDATISVEILCVAPATDADIWLKVWTPNLDRYDYSTTRAAPLASAAALTASSAAWSVVGTRPNNTAAPGLFTLYGRVWGLTVAGTTAASEPAAYATAVDGDTVVDGTASYRAFSRYTLEYTRAGVVASTADTGYFAGLIRARVCALGTNRNVFVAPKLNVSVTP